MMSSIKIERQRINVLNTLIRVALLLSLFNFLLTPNPHAALHSGATGYDADVGSDSFAVHAGLMIAIAIMFSLLTALRLNVSAPWIPFAAVLIIPVSGAVNGAIFDFPFTYLYDYFSFFLVWHLARSMAVSAPYNALPQELWVYAIAFSIFGPLFALLNPHIWGYLPFDFSRETRGEVTLWAMTGMDVVLACLLATILWAKPKSKALFNSALLYWFAITLVVVSTASRLATLKLLLPVFLAFFLGRRWGVRAALAISMTTLIIFFSSDLVSFVTLDFQFGEGFLYDASTGRLELWSRHLEGFIQSPLFGDGAFLISRAVSYFGAASSEIGLLRSFSEYGVFWGAVQVTVMIVACKNAIKILIGNVPELSNQLSVFAALLVLCTLPAFILESHSRILGVSELLFWFFAFYLASAKYHVQPVRFASPSASSTN